MKKMIVAKKAENQAFASKLRELIKASDLKKYEIQEALDLKHYTTVYKWETGENYPSRRNMEKLASLFNVSVGFLRGKEFPQIKTPYLDSHTNESRGETVEDPRPLMTVIRNLQCTITRLETQLEKKDLECEHLKDLLKEKGGHLFVVPEEKDGTNGS